MEPVKEGDIEWTDVDEGGMHCRRKQLAPPAGGDRLGCSLYELPPGERSWPYHYHAANEEALYVLAGSGTLRLDGESHDLSAGDYAAFPADASGSHAVANDGDGTLRYLLLSTMDEPDVTVYPDSEKFGVYVGSPPGSSEERALAGYYRGDDDVDDEEGEDGAGD